MNTDAIRYIRRLFAHQARKMRNLFARGVVNMVQDGLKMQSMQLKLLEGEMIDGAEHPQPYGFTSHAQPGAECFVAFVGADHAHPVVLVVDDRRYRLQSLAEGEVAIYTDEGDKIHLKRGRTVEIETMNLKVNAESSVSFITQQFTVDAASACTINAGAAFTVNAGAAAINAGAIAFASQGGGSVESSFSGSLSVTEDVKAGGISLTTHRHGGVQTGGGTTATPS